MFDFEEPFSLLFWCGSSVFVCFPSPSPPPSFLLCLWGGLLLVFVASQSTELSLSPGATHASLCLVVDTNYPVHGLPVILEIARSQRGKKNCRMLEAMFESDAGMDYFLKKHL